MLHLALTNEEANALAGIIDLAVKSMGVKIAAPAVALMQKLEAAAQKAANDRKPSAIVEDNGD